MDHAVAGGADHEGLAPPVRHGVGPLGLQRPGRAEIFQLADVVGFHLTSVLADLTGSRKEPGEQSLVRVVDAPK